MITEKDILVYIREHPNLTLVQINDGIGSTGKLDDVGYVGWTIGRLMRAGMLERTGERANRFKYKEVTGKH